MWGCGVAAPAALLPVCVGLVVWLHLQRLVSRGQVCVGLWCGCTCSTASACGAGRKQQVRGYEGMDLGNEIYRSDQGMKRGKKGRNGGTHCILYGSEGQ